MAGHRPADPLEGYDYKKVVELLKRWGWSFKAEGVKESYFTFGTHKLTVRRTTKMTWAPIIYAAQVHKVTTDQFMEGPPPEEDATLDSDDIEFFVAHELNELKWPEEKDRWKRVRRELIKRDLLKPYEKVRRDRRGELPPPMEKGPEPQDSSASAPTLPPDPTAAPAAQPAKPPAGALSLDAALAKAGLKQGELSRTACEIICTLSLGGVGDSDGFATRVLHERLPNRKDKVGLPGLTMLVKKLDRAGVIEREMPNVRRVRSIMLKKPVFVKDEEMARWLPDGHAYARITSTPIEPEVPAEPTPEVVEQRTQGWLQVVERQGVEAAEDELHASGHDMGAAIEALREGIEKLNRQERLIQSRRRSLEYAIQVLEGGT